MSAIFSRRVDELIGRDGDCTRVTALLDERRFVTLSGAPGVGKTRLALEIGASLAGGLRDGARFIDFTPLTSLDLVPLTIANALGIDHRADHSITDAILTWTRRKQMLVIFDNCDRVRATIASLASRIIAAAPDVRVLVTSRTPLVEDSSECVYHVPPLSLPPVGEPLDAAGALGYGAVRLFVTAAREAHPAFTLDDGNLDTVVRICRDLEGIPLAICLAAPRLKTLMLEPLSMALHHRLNDRSGSNAPATTKRQTSRHLIDWSYDLLSRSDRCVFRRLAVFAGGASQSAAVAVCRGDDLSSEDTAAALHSLNEKALLVALDDRAERHYALLDATHRFALEKLEEADERFAIERRHAHYFAGHAERLERLWETMPTLTWYDAVDADLDNFRAAHDWSMRSVREAAQGARICAALRDYYRRGAAANEWRRRIDRAIDALEHEQNDDLLARLWLAMAVVGSGSNLFALQRRGARMALEYAERIGNDMIAASALVELAGGEFMNPDFDFRRALERAERIFAERGKGRMLARAHFTHARSLYSLTKDWARAADLYAPALEYSRETGDEHLVAVSMINLAEATFLGGHGDPQGAIRLCEAALPYCRRSSNWRLAATGLMNIATYRLALGDLPGARASLSQSLTIAGEHGLNQVFETSGFCGGYLAALSGDHTLALMLMHHGENFYCCDNETAIEPTERWLRDETLALARAFLSEEAIADLLAQSLPEAEFRAALVALCAHEDAEVRA